tara:strand:+ start:638 stop:784 length:147 start_codon:yes stop_codon:yes gene_type:complete
MDNKIIKITFGDGNNFYFDIEKIAHVIRILKYQIKEGNNVEIIINKAT